MSICLYIGNVGPGSSPHSTENEVRRAFEVLGWDVDPIMERQADDNWTQLCERARAADLVLYTSTQGLGIGDQAVDLWDELAFRGIPTASLHLDLYYGLATPKGAAGIPREECPARHPQFRTAYVFTADGGHEAEFARDGVNHFWLPPAVSEFECVRGTRRDRWASPIGFVGSWQGAYHPESEHRQALIDFLRGTWGQQVRFYPDWNAPGIRGEDLRDVYASVDVVVGDSCMYGYETIPRYCSDRVPETLGRGGFLLHPWVEDVIPGLWEPGEHLDGWTAGNWDALAAQIDYYLAHATERSSIADEGMAWTMQHHTYTQRVRTMLDVMGLA